MPEEDAPEEREVITTKRFEKDIKRLDKRGKNFAKFQTTLNYLKARQALPERYRNHLLVGNWSGHWECHIEPDWLLIYQIIDDVIYLHRSGTHSDLFK